MRRDSIRWLIGVLGTALMFVCSSVPGQAGYSPLPSANSLPGQVTSFAADFSGWSARHDGLFVRILETTPASQRGELVLRLFWLWMLNPWGDAGPGASPSSGGLVGAPARATLAAQPMAGAPAFVLKGGEDLPEIGSTSGNVSSLSNSPPPYSPLSNGPEIQSNPMDALPSDAVAVPEPSALSLLAAGGIGLLMARKFRRETA